ncbi:MAG: hypothetical protein AAGA48_27220 [Myxococcota bacterium]
MRTVLAMLSALACDDGARIEASGPDSGDIEATSEAPPLRFRIGWTLEGITLQIENGSEEGYFFGLAETDGPCNDAGTCWTGEDCLNGFGDYGYCHPMSGTGGTLRYGAAPSDVEEGSTTVFGAPELSSTVTYFIESADAGACWVGGHDPSYYTALGCEIIELQAD